MRKQLKLKSMRRKTLKEKYLRRIANLIGAKLSELPDSTFITIWDALELVYGKMEVVETDWLDLLVFGGKLRVYDDFVKIHSYNRCLDIYLPNNSDYFLDPSYYACKYIGPLGRSLLKKYDSINKTLKELPFKKTEENIKYKEILDSSDHYLKHVFYIPSGKTIKINAVESSIWAWVIKGKVCSNTCKYALGYSLHGKGPLRVMAFRESQILSSKKQQRDIAMKRSFDNRRVHYISFTNIGKKEAVIYVSYC